MIPADAPDWYQYTVNESQAGTCLGKGIGLSRRVNVARDKAMLKAQTELASKITNLNSDTLISLTNTRLVHQKQIREGKYWRVYVVLETEADSIRKE